MEIIPAIDLRDGRCVRLYQGDYARETVFSQDPAEVARRWYDLGASRLHVVDLDGASSGKIQNAAAIQAILRAVPMRVEVGGGIRDLETIEEVLGWGADRVVLGTTAVQQPQLVAQVCRERPDSIVVGIDARNGSVAIQGWRETTSTSAVQFVRAMDEQGVPRFIYTDISRDGTLTEPNFDAIRGVMQSTRRPVIASGGVSNVAHLRRLQELGVEGVIIGQALYTGVLDLKEALSMVAAY